jgi:hypothetical protein
MKRLARLTTLLFLVAAASTAVAVELRWEPRWQSVAPGADGTVAVVLDDALDIRTIEIRVEYDPAVVTGVTSTPGSIYDGTGCFLWEDYEEDTPGFYHAYVVIMGGECHATGPGELLVWHFTAGMETAATTLVPTDVYLSDPNADPHPDVTLGTATIAVIDPPSAAPPRLPESSLRLSPNPFNPSTRLTLTAPSGRPARIDVYDAAGRELTTVWSGTPGPGPIDIDWRGTDSMGRALPSGTYLFRLTSGGAAPQIVRGLLLR